MYDFAREEAKHPKKDAPFGGVPFLLKDAHHALKGFTMSSGSSLLRNHVPEYDAEIVSRFKKAGLIILGKTNTPSSNLPPLQNLKHLAQHEILGILITHVVAQAEVQHQP